MEASPLTESHVRRGARLGERPEAPERTAPLTFGDVRAEWGAVTSGAALFDAAERGALAVTGGDAAAFLHRLLANDVKGLAAGTGNRNLLLSAKGKVRFDFDLAREPERFVLGVQPGRAAGLAAALDTYLFNDDVAIADASAETAPLELAGPGAGAVAARVLGSAPPGVPQAFADRAWRGGAVRVTALDVAGAPGLRLDGGPALCAELWAALQEAGAAPAGLVARDFARIERGAALTGVDVTEDVYPEEAGMLDAFSLTKGCYIGQEVVAKIDTYGGLNKRLCVLRVSHDDPVAAGTRLVRDEDGAERDLGVVTSWGYSFAVEGGLVLAYVKRRHQEPGTRFRLGDSQATAAIVAPPR
jgi:aminomethyltransferase